MRTRPTRRERTQAWIRIVTGIVLLIAGIIVPIATATTDGNTMWFVIGPLGAGVVNLVRGMLMLEGAEAAEANAFGPIPEEQGVISRVLLAIGGYRGFVAQRYLLIPSTKVTPRTTWWLAAFIVLRCFAQATLGAGLDERHLSNPAFTVNRLLEAAIVLVIVLGVLRYTRAALYVFIFGSAITLAGFVTQLLITRQILFHHDRLEGIPQYQAILVIVLIASGAVLAFLALFFGFLRAFFTFFTTVPIGGVWIGTAALVCVLAVMSGFESDLRQKILGSNAHIQISREEGDMTEWHEVFDRVIKTPGVVAATPYATSEVVIASSNNGLPVIIKGIDPNTVGKVTDLVHDLEDKSAMKNLEGKHDGDLDLRVQPRATGGLVDQAPHDLPSSSDPIDYSVPAPDQGSAAGSAAVPPTPAATPDKEPPGADTLHITPNLVDTPPPIDNQDVAPDPNVVDPAPPGLVTSDAPPIDYSKPRTETVDPAIHVLDLPSESPSVVRRTESLPGVLVGAELAKQMHLYVGQEARLVSPLSDPSNPDATGTPIPFNRDYRIAGIFFTGMYEYDLKFIYVSLESFQEFLDRGDVADGIEVRIGSPDDTDAYVHKLGEMLNGPGPFDTAHPAKYRIQDWKELNRSLFAALKLEKIAMFLVLGIVILVASFSIVGNLIMVVVEKQREIALLKTLGASDPGIMQVFAIQGLLIGVIGTVLGVATGLVLCYVGKRVGIPLNPDVYYIDRLPVNVDPQSVGMTFAAGVIISIFATFYPALLGARVRPATGMRH